MAKEELANKDAYSSSMAEVDKFIGRKQMALEPTESMSYSKSPIESSMFPSPKEGLRSGPENNLEIYQIPEATEE